MGNLLLNVFSWGMACIFFVGFFYCIIYFIDEYLQKNIAQFLFVVIFFGLFGYCSDIRYLIMFLIAGALRIYYNSMKN